MDTGTATKANIAQALRLKPQARDVLRHLELYNYITPAIAQNTYSIWRLAACVHEIRKQGIKVETVKRKDAAGHQYASYRLAA